MKKMNKPELYSSQLIDDLLEEVLPSESERVRKKMLLAAKIYDAMKAKGLRKKDLADKFGKQPSEITKWLSGTHNFTTDTLIDLENVLNVDLLNLKEQEVKERVIVYEAVVYKKIERPVLYPSFSYFDESCVLPSHSYSVEMFNNQLAEA